VSAVRYELGVFIQENGILHSHLRGNLKPYVDNFKFVNNLRTITIIFINPVIMDFICMLETICRQST
jgi:hypothetical protein